MTALSHSVVRHKLFAMDGICRPDMMIDDAVNVSHCIVDGGLMLYCYNQKSLVYSELLVDGLRFYKTPA